MNTSFSTQLWIVCKIWFFAVVANTLLGCFYLTGFFTDNDTLRDLLPFGIFYAGVFSIPGMAALLLVLNRCIAAGAKGLTLFRIVFLGGIVLSAAVSLVFWWWYPYRNFGKTAMGTLLCVAVIAAITGIVTQYKSILKTGREFSASRNR
jgi:hypothetical protein